MMVAHPTHRISDGKSVLRQIARGGGGTGDADHAPGVGQAAGIEIEQTNLWDAVVCLTLGLKLIERPSSKVSPKLI